MSETGSFKDNIRRTFIRFSIAPVAAIVTAAFFIFVFSWIFFTTHSGTRENAAISQEITRTINICSEMLEDVSDSLIMNDFEIRDDDIFSILYGRTAGFSNIGNLMILLPGCEAVFSSKGTVPAFLTESDYGNWGVWHLINNNPNETAAILYNQSLFVVRGIFSGSDLRMAVVYMVSGDTITAAVGSTDRFVIITDEHGWVYASNTGNLQDSFGQIDNAFFQKNGFVRYNGDFYYTSSSDTGKGLIVYTISDISRSLQLIGVLIIIVAVIFLAIVLITVRSTENSSEHYTKDIKKIEEAFEKVQNGDLNARLNINSSSEFEVIGNDFNQMLEGLKNQIERNTELAENAAFSQVKQLESQFNPHFLFNTLDNIRFMAKIDEKAADKMIVSLSGLLRYSIRETREEVMVREDLDHLQFYLNILQIRFNKRFSYNMEVSEDIMDYLIPKLLLQPLLENAVKYGFDGRETLNVNIRGYQMQEKLIFVCEDDGAGMDEELLHEIKQNLNEQQNTSNHYGLYNIHRRIYLMYKGDYGLDIDSKKGVGTTIRLTIPKHGENDV